MLWKNTAPCTGILPWYLVYIVNNIVVGYIVMQCKLQSFPEDTAVPHSSTARESRMDMTVRGRYYRLGCFFARDKKKTVPEVFLAWRIYRDTIHLVYSVCVSRERERQRESSIVLSIYR